MRTVGEWLGEYAESHQNPLNERLHFVCVPAIVLAVLGFLWSAPIPAAFASASPWLNWATIGIAAMVVYYLALSPALALGALLVLGALLAVLHALASLPWPLWATSLAIFVVAWIGQFLGHACEGQRPSFFKDLQFLLIGPLWVIAAVYRRCGLQY